MDGYYILEKSILNMKIIAKYIGINILKGICLAAVLLLGVDLLFYFINELRFIGTGDYNLLAAIEFIVLTVPRKLYIMAPWSALIGSLLVLGAMAKNCELVAMRAAGISANKIAWFVSYYVLFFTIIVFLSGELLAPKIELFAQKRKTLALSQGKAMYTSYGTWMRTNNKFIHIAHIKNHNILSKVTIYELDQNFKLKRTKFAETAKLIDNNIWELQNVLITDLPDNTSRRGSPGVIILNKESSQIESNLVDLNILQVTGIKHLERLSIVTLAKVIKDRLANNLTVLDYKVAFWKKIVQPFSILIMSYLAVPFVLGPLRSCSKGLRLLVGIIIGFLFHLLNALFCPLVAVIDVPPSMAVMLPPIFFLCLSVYLAARA